MAWPLAAHPAYHSADTGDTFHAWTILLQRLQYEHFACLVNFLQASVICLISPAKPRRKTLRKSESSSVQHLAIDLHHQILSWLKPVLACGVLLEEL